MPSLLEYGVVNGYEALVNAIVGDIVLVVKAKRMPGMETLLKHGLEKAIINVVSSIAANYMPMTNINALDYEYLLTGAIAGVWASAMKSQGFVSAAEDQALVSIIAHAVSSKTIGYGTGALDWAVGNTNPLKVNTGTPLYY